MSFEFIKKLPTPNGDQGAIPNDGKNGSGKSTER